MSKILSSLVDTYFYLLSIQKWKVEVSDPSKVGHLILLNGNTADAKIICRNTVNFS